jgi:hypothetical protein
VHNQACYTQRNTHRVFSREYRCRNQSPWCVVRWNWSKTMIWRMYTRAHWNMKCASCLASNSASCLSMLIDSSVAISEKWALRTPCFNTHALETCSIQASRLVRTAGRSETSASIQRSNSTWNLCDFVSLQCPSVVIPIDNLVHGDRTVHFYFYPCLVDTAAFDCFSKAP